MSNRININISVFAGENGHAFVNKFFGFNEKSKVTEVFHEIDESLPMNVKAMKKYCSQMNENISFRSNNIKNHKVFPRKEELNKRKSDNTFVRNKHIYTDISVYHNFEYVYQQDISTKNNLIIVILPDCEINDPKLFNILDKIATNVHYSQQKLLVMPIVNCNNLRAGVCKHKLDTYFKQYAQEYNLHDRFFDTIDIDFNDIIGTQFDYFLETLTEILNINCNQFIEDIIKAQIEINIRSYETIKSIDDMLEIICDVKYIEDKIGISYIYLIVDEIKIILDDCKNSNPKLCICIVKKLQNELNYSKQKCAIKEFIDKFEKDELQDSQNMLVNDIISFSNKNFIKPSEMIEWINCAKLFDNEEFTTTIGELSLQQLTTVTDIALWEDLESENIIKIMESTSNSIHMKTLKKQILLTRLNSAYLTLNDPNKIILTYEYVMRVKIMLKRHVEDIPEFISFAIDLCNSILNLIPFEIKYKYIFDKTIDNNQSVVLEEFIIKELKKRDIPTFNSDDDDYSDNDERNFFSDDSDVKIISKTRSTLKFGDLIEI